jgi:hypothetical protein
MHAHSLRHASLLHDYINLIFTPLYFLLICESRLFGNVLFLFVVVFKLYKRSWGGWTRKIAESQVTELFLHVFSSHAGAKVVVAH